MAPLSMGFSRQGYSSGLPCPPPGDLPYPGIKPMSSALQVDFFYHLGYQESPKIGQQDGERKTSTFLVLTSSMAY